MVISEENFDYCIQLCIYLDDHIHNEKDNTEDLLSSLKSQVSSESMWVTWARFVDCFWAQTRTKTVKRHVQQQNTGVAKLSAGGKVLKEEEHSGTSGAKMDSSITD